MELFSKKNLKYLPLFIFVVFAVVAFVLYSLKVRKINQTSEDKLARVDQAIAAKEYSKATTDLAIMIKENPHDIHAYKKLLDIYITKNRLKDAENIYKTMEGLFGKKAINIESAKMGNLFMKNEEYEKAIYFYKNIDPQTDSSKLAIAKAYLYLGDTQSAENILSTVSSQNDLYKFLTMLSKTPNVDEMGNLLKSFGSPKDDFKYKDCLNDLSSSLKEADDDKSYLSVLFAQNLTNCKFYNLSQKLLEEHTKDYDKYWEGWYLMGVNNFYLHNFNKSITDLQNAIAAGGTNPQIFVFEARSYYESGDAENAEKAYDAALTYANISKDNLKYAWIIAEYIDMLEDQQVYTKIKQLLEKYSFIDTDWFIDKQLRYFYHINDFKSLNAVLQKAVSRLDSMEVSYLRDYYKYMLIYLNKQGKVDTMEDVLRQYKQKVNDPYDPYYYVLQAYVLKVKNDVSGAKESLYKALDYDETGAFTKEAQNMLASL